MSKTPDDASVKQSVEAAEANNTAIEQIVQNYSAKIKDNNVSFKPNIPKNKLHIALNTYAKGVRETDVLVLIDNTVYGTAKDGGLLTASALYVHNYWENPKHMSLADVTEVSLVGNIQCKVYINGLKYLDAFAPERDALMQFTQMLQDISEHVHAGIVIPSQTLKEPELPKEPVAYIQAPTKSISSEITSECAFNIELLAS